MVECKICYKKIKTYRDIINQLGKNITGKCKSHSITLSNEGIYFEEGNAWFCNECYKKINGPKI